MTRRSSRHNSVQEKVSASGTAARRFNRVKQALDPWIAFWTKLSHDWVFNFSGLLAYNLITSLFPIVLVLLATAGLLLSQIAPQALEQLQAIVEQAVPGGSEVVAAVLNRLANSSQALLILGVITSAVTGSHLFVVIENCFGIIFRVRGRDGVRQQVMAFGMLLLYVILVAVIALASLLPSIILSFFRPYVQSSALDVLTYVLSFLIVGTSACLLFGAIYYIVPNRHMRAREVWPGTLVAALLLILFEVLFPVYTRYFFHMDNYGALAGFMIVLLLFFYYLGFILLLGAEVNSWIAGLRPIKGDPTWLFNEWLQTSNRGAKDLPARTDHEN